MPSTVKKISNCIMQTLLLPVYMISWLLGNPHLMTLLCILSEVLVELVVSAVMAGVSLVVSAVILMEEDPGPVSRPLPSIKPPSFFDDKLEEEAQKAKATSTRTLRDYLKREPVTEDGTPKKFGGFYGGRKSKQVVPDPEAVVSEIDKEAAALAEEAAAAIGNQSAAAEGEEGDTKVSLPSAEDAEGEPVEGADEVAPEGGEAEGDGEGAGGEEAPAEEGAEGEEEEPPAEE